MTVARDPGVTWQDGPARPVCGLESNFGFPTGSERTLAPALASLVQPYDQQWKKDQGHYADPDKHIIHLNPHDDPASVARPAGLVTRFSSFSPPICGEHRNNPEKVSYS